MMARMCDGVANPSKEIERSGLRDRQTQGHLSNKKDEQDFAKGVSHLFRKILAYFEQSFNDQRVKLNRRGLFSCASLNVSSKRTARLCVVMSTSTSSVIEVRTKKFPPLGTDAPSRVTPVLLGPIAPSPSHSLLSLS